MTVGFAGSSSILIAQVPDIDAQILRVVSMGRSPYRRQNLPMRQDAASVPREKQQQLKFFRTGFCSFRALTVFVSA